MAMLVQALSAKLGIATGLNLAEHCRNHFSRPVVIMMWGLMEIVAMATDLAEFLGAAVGFNLLFGIPLWLAGIMTAIATFLILGLERYGFRPLEAVITALVGIVSVSYLIETVLDRPNWGDVLYHSVVPQFSGTESVLLATGIVGATVMPHAIYLHSALTQGRIVVKDPSQLKRLFRYEMVDVIVAMGLASLVNMAMLIMAASTFFKHGLTEVGTLRDSASHSGTIAGQGIELDLRRFPSGFRSVFLCRRDDGRPGHDAGIPAAANPRVDPPTGYDYTIPGRYLHRSGPDAHPGNQPGRAQFRTSVRDHSPDHVHQTQNRDGSIG